MPSSAPAADGAVPTSVAAITGSLRKAGLNVQSAGTLNQPFFPVAAQVFTVDGNDLQIYAFGDTAAAQNAAAQVSSDGGSVGATSVAWMAPPHFFRKENVIAISVGGTPKALDELQRIFGSQFAGRH